MLDEALELHGSWWLPEEPSRRIAGTLFLGPTKFSLLLEDSIHPPQLNPKGDPWESLTIPKVYGTAIDGKTEVTLLDCSGLKTLAAFTYVRESWTPNAALIGRPNAARIERRPEGHDEPRFRVVSIYLEHLDSWANAPGIRATWRPEPELGGFDVSVKRSVLQSADLLGSTVELVSFPSFSRDGNVARIELQTKIDVRLHEPAPWSQLLVDWIGPLRELVALGTGSPVGILSVKVTPAEGVEGTEESFELRYRYSSRAASGKRIHREEMPMLASELPGGWEQGLANWSRIREKHVMAIQALGTVLHAPHMYVDDRLVALVRASEAYHAVVYGASEGATLEHADRIEKVMQSTVQLSPEIVDWLSMALSKNTEPPVARHRILELVTHMGEVGDVLAGGKKERFASAVIQTRNLIVHPQSTPGAHALLDAEGRFWHSEALLWLLRGLIFTSLGLTVQKVMAGFERSGRYQHVVDAMGRLQGPDSGQA